MKPIRHQFMVKVFFSGPFYAERALKCLERRGFDPKDFRVELDFPHPGDASLVTDLWEQDRMAWEEAKHCLVDPADEPLPPGLGRRKKRKLGCPFDVVFRHLREMRKDR